MSSDSSRNGPVLGVGIIGLGGAARGMISKFARRDNVRIVAAADIDAEILGRFAKDFPDADTYDSAEALCSSANVDLVYIATPNRFHSEHARLALEARKHVLIEKPMTIALDAADVMIDAADRNGVLLGVNVKHSFEPRVARVREMVASGELGRLRMINSWRFADWLYRPRTPEELTPEWGGGALWRQGPHQLDIIRTIGGGLVRSVRGLASAWDDSRRVTGAHAAYLDFEEGAVATAVFSGYDHYNSRELVYGMGSVDPSEHAAARAELRAAPSAEWEAQAARDERYGGERSSVQPRAVETPAPSGGWILGGPMMISFDHADVRMSPNGLDVYGDESRWEIELRGPKDGRDGRIDSFYEAIVNGKELPADGRWGKATLEVLLAIEESGRERAEVRLAHQTRTVDA